MLGLKKPLHSRYNMLHLRIITVILNILFSENIIVRIFGPRGARVAAPAASCSRSLDSSCGRPPVFTMNPAGRPSRALPLARPPTSLTCLLECLLLSIKLLLPVLLDVVVVDPIAIFVDDAIRVGVAA